jgi:hypothetical protein
MLRFIQIASIVTALTFVGIAPVFADPGDGSGIVADPTISQPNPDSAQTFFTQPDGSVALGVQNADSSWSTSPEMASAMPASPDQVSVVAPAVVYNPAATASSGAVDAAIVNSQAPSADAGSSSSAESYYTQPDGSVTLGGQNADSYSYTPGLEAAGQ